MNILRKISTTLFLAMPVFMGGMEKELTQKQKEVVAALNANDSNAIEKLLKEKVVFNFRISDTYAYSPIQIAARWPKHIKILKLLLQHTCEDSVESIHPHNLMGIACDHLNCEAVEVLIKHDKKFVNMPSNFILNFTPLHRFITESSLSLAKLLIEKGANVNLVSGQQRTPLHEAVWNTNPEAVEELIKAGAKIDVQSGQGFTPLDEALSAPWVGDEIHDKHVKILLSAYCEQELLTQQVLTNARLVLNNAQNRYAPAQFNELMQLLTRNDYKA